MDFINPTKIKVFGVGGGGCNAVNRMYLDGIENVELYALNTDIQHLSTLAVPNKLQIGEKITRGLGAGARPEIGEQAALEDLDKIKEILRDTDMLFIAVGLGGGTGTGAAPVIAQAAKEMNILTVCVCTKPFNFEGPKRAQVAEEGLQKIKDVCDTYIVINNQRLHDIADRNLTIGNAFKMVDDILSQAVRGITSIVTTPALINVDFADVKTIMQDGGLSLIGIGTSKNSDKLDAAVEQAMHSPLLEGNSIKGSKRLMVTLWVDQDTPFTEIESSIAKIREEADDNALIIFGAVVLNENEGQNTKVAIVATDFEENVKAQQGLKVIKTQEKESKKEEKPRVVEPQAQEEEDLPAYLRRKRKI